MKMVNAGVALLLLVNAATAAGLDQIRAWINQGRWQDARREIEVGLARPGLDFAARQALLFEQDRMARIAQDFNKTREQIFREARAIVPAVDEELLSRWEKAGGFEFMEIDGERRFFNRAAGNVFRIYPEAKALKAKIGVTAPKPYRLEDVRRVLAEFDRTGEHLNTPKKTRVTYTLSVKPGVIPAGEVIRAWLPFPQTGGRQEQVRLVSSDPAQFVQSGATGPLSCVYLERPALEKEATKFKLVFEYTAKAFYQPIDAERVGAARATGLDQFLAEQPPHLVFSEEIRKLSREIVGAETNTWVKARRIFQWIDEHIPWAGAREYSTMDCLPSYALQSRHGDCGIQTMLFMTLCRLNGIPARWETGWTTGLDKNMHDWCEIYLAPYGWVPADASYGLVRSDNEREKWFYLGGIDQHRLVVNTDHTQALYPAKTFFRSEIVDFQRGEVEWRGGNLYFNQWDWDFQVEELSR
jgi:transglutaminase-like putative cysteine protease